MKHNIQKGVIPMSTEQLKAMDQRFYQEVWSQGNLDLLDELLINRTLVYGLLTASLLAVYLVLVFAVQTLLSSLLGHNNDLVLVGSTLIVAALFQPLRHRIQQVIDRRFYRRKYDAAKIIAAYSATLRNEVDLNHLREELVHVVQETMQPAHVSLWLRSP
jgi:hypothetical protein